MRKKFSILPLILLFGALLLVLDSCEEPSKEKPFLEKSFLYKNLSEKARYIGAEECKICHPLIYDKYINTEMGHSFKKASLANSSANFHQQKPVFDDFKNMYYQPFSKGEKLFLKEYRLSENSRDTVYQRNEEISYIIGSGQHTNSHLMQVNGYVHQMPLTFYTQKGEWDLPPGFENGGNTSFDRPIEVECMTCHNGFAEYVEGSKNRYSVIPQGIDCERCHGPGSIHAIEKKAGSIVDITKQIDYSIVNPGKLSPELQMDVCQRCHLQGISVLKEGKSFFDFKPGMKLNEVFEVYQSRFKDSLTSFLMASHPDRLRMSVCYISSNKNNSESGMTCITCHDPHVSVRDVKPAFFNSKCMDCHKELKCSEQMAVRNKLEDNCITCHMSRSSSYDIPHVSITDHRISRFPVAIDFKKEDIAKSEYEKQKDFIRLVCRTSDGSNHKLNAKAYLNYYEKYAQNPELLKEAEDYLKKYDNQDELFNLYVRLYFLQDRYVQVEKYSANRSPELIIDEWTAYRIGQSLMNLKKYGESLLYLERAVELAPLDLDFNQKLAANYSYLNQLDRAEGLLFRLVDLYPKNASIYNDLGFAIVSNSGGSIDGIIRSEEYFLKSIALNPDLLAALENLTSYYLNIGDKSKAELYYDRLVSINPNEPKYDLLKEAIEELP
jgi:tetratricopeptide (TPR) repeat protein